ncbi:MAG TPA: putative baseplate assembly protein [Blastocatellia bacterium]|nr:putative baseplate assembly protein [Blastocatellia bacterium]
MQTQYRCRNRNRQDAVRTARGEDGNPILNGIDYLEVASADQKTISLVFIHPVPGQADAVPPPPASDLSEKNFRVEGGVRTQGVRVVSASSSNNTVTLTVNEPGDFSIYTLRLVSSADGDVPPEGFDPQLSAVDFSFKVECPSEFDCRPVDDCPPERSDEPLIDYLAKDYGSFRRLMLDRIATTMPDWKERNPSDMGVALVEAVAYVADHLSYYQDAVASESYLGTARQRVSVRRHARLLDYRMHDGSNARAWVCFEVEGGSDGLLLQAGTPLLTRGSLEDEDVMVDPSKLEGILEAALDEKPLVFETLHPVTLRSAHNEIRFYTWGDVECCLPRGATRATLRNSPALSLEPGDCLIFEEVISPFTGQEADADPARRQAVRLTRVIDKGAGDSPLTDPLTGEQVVEVEWAVGDALSFPLCLSAKIERETGDEFIEDASVARGNVVLADHGLTVSEPLGEIGAALENSAGVLLKEGPVTEQGRVRDFFNRPVLDAEKEPAPFDPSASAASAMRWQMRDALSVVRLIENGDDSKPWRPRHDLLGSDRFDRHFVLEVDNGGRARLRFGDGAHGARPKAGSDFVARYRTGNGPEGNVGRGSISRVVLAGSGIKRARNPLPAAGGASPESMEEVRLYAPQAFRTQERAVTEADYAEVAGRHPEVQKAVATLRWTGSWYTVFITVDRRGGRPVDAAFKSALGAFLERFRMAGEDLEIDGPRFVPLDIAFGVCVAPGYFRSQVKADLLRLFSNRDLPSGRRGFFHPDNFTFGQTLYLSRMIAEAMRVPGVLWVDAEDVSSKPNRFRRWGQPAHDEYAEGRIAFGRLEIARLDNDPSLPENGRIEFLMEGGL